MYAMPSPPTNLHQPKHMQRLHITHDWLTSAITAPIASCFSESSTTSRYSIDPYLHRVYWVLTNSEGLYLAAIYGTVLQWVKSPNEIPAELRSCSHETVKSRWIALQNVHGLDIEGLSIQPIDFYAHRSTPHIWCALDD
jgi:hypothetical protein